MAPLVLSSSLVLNLDPEWLSKQAAKTCASLRVWCAATSATEEARRGGTEGRTVALGSLLRDLFRGTGQTQVVRGGGDLQAIPPDGGALRYGVARGARGRDAR